MTGFGDGGSKMVGSIGLNVSQLQKDVIDGSSSIDNLNKKLSELQKTLQSFDSSLGGGKGGKKSQIQAEIEAIQAQMTKMEQALQKQAEVVKKAQEKLDADLEKYAKQRKGKAGKAEEQQTSKLATETKAQLDIYKKMYSERLITTQRFAQEVNQIEKQMGGIESSKKKEALEKQVAQSRISMLGRMRQHYESHNQEMTSLQKREVESLKAMHSEINSQYKNGLMSAKEYHKSINALQEMSASMPMNSKIDGQLNKSSHKAISELKKQKEAEKSIQQEFDVELMTQQRASYKKRLEDLKNSLKKEHYSLKKHKESMKALQKEIALSGHSTDLTQQAQKEVDLSNRKMIEKQRQYTKNKKQLSSTMRKERLESARKQMNDELAIARDLYSKKISDAKKYSLRLRRIEKEARDSGVLDPKAQAKIKAEQENAYNSQVKGYIQKRIHMHKDASRQELDIHKNQMLAISRNARLGDTQRNMALKEYYSAKNKIRKVDLQRELQHQKELRKAGATYGSTQQKFRTLSNYAFDATIIYGSIRALREMYSVVSDIERASVDLSRVMPTADKFDLENFRTSAFDIGFDTGQMITDVQQIQNLWSRTSDEIANNQQALEYLTRVTSTAMNIGGFTDAQEAVQLMNATINQMNLHWTDAEDILNSWSKTANTTAVRTAKELADSTMRVGAQAQKLGLEYHDINAITGVLANNMARSGEEIGTALKTIFTYMLRDETVEVLEKHGVEVMRTANEYNDFLYIMQQLNKVYRDLELSGDQTGIREIDESLGRVRRIDYVGNLLGNFGEFNDILASSIDSTDYAMKQNEIVAESLEFKIRSLMIAFQELAWEVGQAGLLDDITSLVNIITSGVKSFADMDDASKALIYRLAMVGVASTVLSKSLQLLTNHSLTGGATKIAKSIPRAGMAIAGLFKHVKYGDRIMSTGTQRMVGLTKATGKYAVASKSGALAQGAMNTSVAGFISPAGAVLAILAGSIALYSAYSASVKQAREEAEKMEKAQRDLAEMSNSSFIPEHALESSEEELAKRIAKLNEYKDAIEKLSGNDGTGTRTLRKGGEEFQVDSQEIIDAKKNVKELEKELRLMGISLDDIAKYNKTGVLPNDLLEFEALIFESHNREFRELAELMDDISGTVDRNKRLAEMVSQYRDLKESAKEGGDALDDFLTVNKLLRSAYPELIGEMDHDLEVRTMQIDALEEVTKNVYALTDSQMDNLTHSRAWSDDMIDSMKDMTARSNLMTQQMIRETKARIQAMQSELSAMELLSGMPSAKTMVSPGGMGRFSALQGEKENLRDYNSEIERMGILIESLDEIADRQGIGIKDREDDSKSGGNDHRIEADRYYHLELALTKYNNALDINKSLQSLTKDDFQRVKLMEQEIEMTKQKVKAVDDLNKAQRTELTEVTNRLSAYGFNVVNGEIKNLNDNIKNFSGETAQIVESDLNRFKDLVSNIIPTTTNEMMSLRVSILGVQDAIAEMNQSMIDSKVALFNSMEDKVVEIVKDRIEKEKQMELDKIKGIEDAENRRHKNAMDRLDAERDAFNKFIDEKLRALKDEADRQNFEDDLDKMTEEKLELQKLYDELMLDDRVESQHRAFELAKQIADKEYDLERFQRDRTQSEREKSLNDQKDRYAEEYQQKVDLEKRSTELEQLSLQERIEQIEKHYEAKLERGALFAEAQKYMTSNSLDELTRELVAFEDRFGDGLRATGDLIKRELIDNLQQAINLMSQVGYSGGSTMGSGITNHVNSGGSGMSMDTVYSMIYSAGQKWNLAKSSGDTAGMSSAHQEAERLRMENGMNYGDPYGAPDANYDEWRRRMGLTAHAGGLLNFKGSDEKLIMAKRNELVSSPLDTQRLLKISNMLTSSLPSIRSVVGNVSKSKPSMELKIGTLVEVNGSMMAEQLDGVDRFANVVVDKLFGELKDKGGL